MESLRKNQTWKMTLLGLIIFIIAQLFSTASSTEASTPITVYVDHQAVEFSVEPSLKQGTTLVQLRPLFESLGITLDWDAENKTIHGQKGEHSFTLTIGQMNAEVNGEIVSLTLPATIEDGHTLVPLRFVGEATDAIVGWNGQKRIINVYSTEYLFILEISENEAQQLANEAKFVSERSGDGLRGLFANGSLDLMGYRNCNGVCWDYYYFINDHQFIKSRPEHGWETVDCSEDNCLTYELKGDELVLSSGTTHRFEILSNGSLLINGDTYTHYEPYNRLKLDGKYVSSSYTNPTAGIGLASTNEFFFHPDGTFSSDNWLGVLIDGSDSGNQSGVSHTLTSSSETAGTYTIINHTLLLQYKDGTIDKRMFFLPDKNFEFMRIGGRDFFFVETNFDPLEDRLVLDGIAEKDVFSDWELDKEASSSQLSITLNHFQWAQLKIADEYVDAFTGFGDETIIALTALYTITNESNQTLNVSDIETTLVVDAGYFMETAALAPEVQSTIQPGEQIQKMSVFLMPVSEFNRFDFYDFVFNEGEIEFLIFK